MNNLLEKIPAVPGVYYEPGPRVPEAPLVRTDVAGFIGFEPRITNGTNPSRMIDAGGAPVGHEFNVDITGFAVDIGVRRTWVPQVANLPLSVDTGSIPIDDGQGIVYSLVAALNAGGNARLHVLPGDAGDSGRERALSDEEIAALAACITDGTTPSCLNGGHQFNIDVPRFHVQIANTVHCIREAIDFSLSAGSDVPIADGQSMVYALLAVEKAGAAELMAVAGTAKAAGSEQPPANADIRARLRAQIGAGSWVRIADVHVKRLHDTVAIAVADPSWVRIADIHVTRAGTAIYLTVVPNLPPACLEDWKDYLLRFGVPRADGTLLAPAVRAFFANGGRRCHVATVRRPDFVDSNGLQQALEEMVGVKSASAREATGLERLLLIPEVSIIDVPELHATRAAAPPAPFELPSLAEAACFRDCEKVGPAPSAIAESHSQGLDPLFSASEVQAAQTRMLHRCLDEHWRVFLLLNVPREFDLNEGRFGAPSPRKALEWREYFAGLGEEPQKMSCAGLYFPWLLAQEHVDAPVVEMPPTPFVAGVMARRDLKRGPHIAPANETVRGVVGLTRPIDDQINSELYEPPTNINILRPFAGYGVQVWGARTLSSDKWLRYVSVRRCLSAIERRAAIALEPFVFEPNTPMLWLQVTQLLLDILLPVFESGALRGKRPDEAFYIRCDAGVNPPEQIEQGIMVCEVGVAIAAPAEFIVFRLGRREGVVEVME